MTRRKEAMEETGALTPWRPLGELEPRPTSFGAWPRSRFAEEFFRDWPRIGGERWLPAMDVSENDAHYAVTVELPGAKKDDVHVELEDGVLTIRGEKSSEREEKKEQSRYVERCYGSFCRSLRLPADADADHLKASFEDGVLAITVPKLEAAKPRSIAIKAS